MRIYIFTCTIILYVHCTCMYHLFPIDYPCRRRICTYEEPVDQQQRTKNIIEASTSDKRASLREFVKQRHKEHQ